MADRTPTRSQRTNKPYERPSPSTPNRDSVKADGNGTPNNGGLLRTLFNTISSPFRHTPNRKAILPSSASKVIDLESGGRSESPSRSSGPSQQRRQSPPQSQRAESSKMGSQKQKRHSGRFSADVEMGSDTEDQVKGGAEEEDENMEEEETRKGGPSKPYVEKETQQPRGSKRHREELSPQRDQKQEGGNSSSSTKKLWDILSEPSQSISFDEYISLVAEFKNAKQGQELSEVEKDGLKDLYDMVEGPGGRGHGKESSPNVHSSGITASGRGLFGSPISGLSKSRSMHFGGEARAFSPSPVSAFNTPTRAAAAIPLPTSKSAIFTDQHQQQQPSPSGSSAAPSPSGTPQRLIAGSPSRLGGKMRQYVGPGRSSLSASVSGSRLSESAAGGSLRKSVLGASVLGKEGMDVDMDASADLKASTSSNGSQNKAKKSPPKTQAAAELQSMIDSMDAEAKQKIPAQAIVNPYEGACFNIGSSSPLPNAPASSSSAASKPGKRRTRLSLKSSPHGKDKDKVERETEKEKERERTGDDDMEVEVVEAAASGRSRGRKTDMELIEEADRQAKRSRPNPSSTFDFFSKPTAAAAPAPTPKSALTSSSNGSKSLPSSQPGFSFANMSASNTPVPKPLPVPAKALKSQSPFGPFMADLSPKADKNAPSSGSAITFQPVPVPVFNFGTAAPTSSTTKATSTDQATSDPIKDVAQLDKAALPITTFSALSGCKDLSSGISWNIKQQVLNMSVDSLPTFVFKAMEGEQALADLADLFNGDKKKSTAVAPAATAPIKEPPPSAFNMAGWAPPKQKEGTWKCSSCDCLTDNSASKCVSCEAPKPSDPKASSSQPTLPTSGFNMAGWAPPKQKEGTWKCKSCDCLTDNGLEKCSVCESPRP